MKTSREHKRLIARARSAHAKSNGVISGWWFDRAEFIWKHADRKRRAEIRARLKEGVVE